MKLSEFAEKTKTPYQTAYKWFKNGKIPGAKQRQSGGIYVPNTAIQEMGLKATTKTQVQPTVAQAPVQEERYKNVIYARVPAKEQEQTEMQARVDKLVQFSIANGWVIDQIVKDTNVASNENREKLWQILQDTKMKRLIVEKRGQLSHVGYRYLESLTKQLGIELIIANKAEDYDKIDLYIDLKAIIASLCKGIYPEQKAQFTIQQINNILK